MAYIFESFVLEGKFLEIIKLFALASALAMDAFAVSITQGLSSQKFIIKRALIIALTFGLFQMLMPLLGYLLGSQLAGVVSNIDHFVAFVLLSIIGMKMIIDGVKAKTDEVVCQRKEEFKIVSLITLGIATSIDAFAVGITFAFLKVKLIVPLLMIGIVTFVLSFFGVKMGCTIGYKYKNKAEIFGGIVLILIGLHILLEHIGIL